MSSRNDQKASRKLVRAGRKNSAALQRACQSVISDARQWETMESRVLFAIPVAEYNFDTSTDTGGVITTPNTGTSGASQNGTLVDGATIVTTPRDPLDQPEPALRPLSPAGGGYLNVTGTSARMDVGTLGTPATWLHPVLNGTSSLAFWIRTNDQVGMGNAWQSPGVTGAEVNTGNDIFWGNLTPDARIRVNPGDGGASVSTTQLSTDVDADGDRTSAGWVHVVETRNAVTGALRTYVNGKLENSAQGDIGVKATWFRAIGATSNSDPSGQNITSYVGLVGDLDNVQVYNEVLGPVEVAQKYGPPAAAVPATPAGLVATTPTVAGVRLTFTDSGTAVGYRVLRSTTAGGPFTEIGLVSQDAGSPNTVFNDAGLTVGQQYFYQVIAYNAAGESAAATADATPVATGNGITGSYYNHPWWGATPGRPADVTTDVTIGANPTIQRTIGTPVAFNYGLGSPGPGIGGDNHSTVHSGSIVFDQVGDYYVLGFGDDDTAVYVNGGLASNDPGGHGPPGNNAGGIASIDVKNVITVGGAGSAFQVGVPYDLVVIQAEQGGGSAVFLRWITPGGDATNGPAQDVPVDNLRTSMKAPEAPTVTVDSNATAFPTFTYTDATESEVRYVLQRKLASEPASAFRTVRTGAMKAETSPELAPSGQTGTLSDAVVTPGNYVYRVGAENPNGAAYSAEVAVAVPGIAPEAGAEGYYFNSQFWGSTARPPNYNITVGRTPDFFENVGDVVEVYDLSSPEPGVIQNDNFSTAFTGKLKTPDGASGAYQILAFSDDDSYVWVNNVLVSADPGGHGTPGNNAGGIASIDVRTPITLAGGTEYNFVAVQSEGGGGAAIILRWMLPGTTEFVDIPAEAFTSNIPNAAPDLATGAPAAPTGVGVAAADNQGDFVIVRWTDNSANEMRQTVEVTNVTTGAVTSVDVPINANSRAITGLTANTAYTIRVLASNFNGETASATATSVTTSAGRTQPAAPTIVRVRPRAGGTQLVFTDNSFNETGFVVERSVNGGAFVEAGTVAASAPNATGGTLAFNDTAAAAGENIVYRLRAAGTPAPAGGGDSATVTSTSVLIPVAGTGLRERAFDDLDFTGSDGVPEPVTSVQFNIDENFGGGAPAAGLGADQFSIIYDGELVPELTGSYRFGLSSDDGVSMLLLDPVTKAPIINFNNLAARRGANFGFPQDVLGAVNLVAGTRYPVEFRMVEDGGGAGIKVFQSIDGRAFETLPGATLFPTTDGNAAPTIAPTLTGSALGLERITVSLADFNFTETGLELEQGTSATGPFTQVATFPANVIGNTFTLEGPFTANTPIFFRARATGANGTFSPFSPVLDVTPVNPADETRTRLTLNRTAKFITVPTTVDDDGQALQLTDNINGQTGTAFLTDPRVVNRDFVTQFRFQIPEGNGADGFAFVIQGNDPNAIGGGGGALGYQGILNSLAVKFDIYNNINQTGVYLNGEAVTDAGTNIGFEIDNGNVYEVTLTYNADGADVDGDGTPDVGTDSDAITVKIANVTDPTVVPFEQTFSTSHSGAEFDIDTLVGREFAYLGFTGATGGLNAEQNILDWSFNGQDIPFGSGPTPPVPAIQQVYVRNAAWSADFKTFLFNKGLGDGVYGYRADTVTTTLPWINMNQIVLKYSGPITAAGLVGGTVVLDGQQSDYTVTAVEQLDPQSVVLTLNRALGIQPAGSPDITLGDRIKLTVPGAGPAGSAYNLTLNVLQGDADRSANQRVATTDVNFIKARLNRNSTEVPPAGATYTAFADLNGDGRILTPDINAAKARLNDVLPPAPPVAAALFSDSRIADEILA